ncbi:molybdenum cofactor cytidylyltransferase, partial [Chloroflexota bacterium]
MISVILLAAGESRRMGKLKQLLPYGKATIMEQAIENLAGSRAGDIIVVLGYRADDIRQHIKHKQIRIVINQHYLQGMSSSIKAGLKAVANDVEYLMLALADQPCIGAETINQLIDKAQNSDKGIFVPVYRGRRGHPVLFSIRYKDEMMGLVGDVGGKQLLKNHAEDVAEIKVDCPGVLQDIDTMYDYL